MKEGQRRIAEIASDVAKIRNLRDSRDLGAYDITWLGDSSPAEAEKMHWYPPLSVPGRYAGNVQFVPGRNRPARVLQVERRHLCFH